MKTRMLLHFIILSVLSISVISCQKEDALFANQKSIKKSWALQQYLHNNVDHTSAMTITGLDESYTDNNKYDRSYTDKNGNKVVETGTFVFENAEKIHISGVGSMELSPEVGTVSSSTYNVIKVTDTQLWYYFMNGSDRHEFHFTRK